MKLGGIFMDLIPKNIFFREIFDDLLDMPTLKSAEMMRSDIYEEGNNYIIEVDIPGFQKENIFVDYEKGYLNIKAQKSKETNDEDKEKKYLRRERYYGEFKRSFYIGDIDESQIEANFENGILKVLFPKKQAEDKNKKLIEIK
jgi:HSP20 family protein